MVTAYNENLIKNAMTAIELSTLCNNAYVPVMLTKDILFGNILISAGSLAYAHTYYPDKVYMTETGCKAVNFDLVIIPIGNHDMQHMPCIADENGNVHIRLIKHDNTGLAHHTTLPLTDTLQLADIEIGTEMITLRHMKASYEKIIDNFNFVKWLFQICAVIAILICVFTTIMSLSTNIALSILTICIAVLLCGTTIYLDSKDAKTTRKGKEVSNLIDTTCKHLADIDERQTIEHHKTQQPLYCADI